MSHNDGEQMREELLICKALALAIAIVPHLPEDWLIPTERDEMQRLLRARSPKHHQQLQDLAAEVVAQLEERYRQEDESNGR
jgi:hypothetical protein